MAIGGLALKSLSWFLRIIEFCCAAIIIGIYSYFLAALSSRHLYIAAYIKAVEGISGAAVLYTIFALLLVCCLGGVAFFSVLGMVLDLAFTGAFIYLAYATRSERSCSGIVNTPLGAGDASSNTVIVVGNTSSGFVRLPSLHTACKLNTACFAVAIVGAVFFFISIFVEYGLIQHRRKERAFGPSPNNGYTAGSPKRKFWQRKPKNRDAEFAAGEKNPDALPAHTSPADVRTSYATDATAVGNEPVLNKYGHTAAPVSTGANGYGYQTNTTTHTPHGGYQAYNPNTTANTNF